jgi:hypothetical protein
MKKLSFFFAILFLFTQAFAQTDLRKAFLSPPESAKPWVFWYWLNGAVSAEGITADLEAMKNAGLGGAYLMPIKDTTSIYAHPARQLSPLWWKMVKHAMAEAKRLDLKLGIHVSDGFALAGGPWITPEKSMQKLVWSTTNVIGGKLFSDTLATPEANENFYRDVAVFAFPSLPGAGVSTKTVKPKITSSNNETGLQYLIDPANKKNFVSEDSCWIQYEFQQPFTLRTVVIHSRINYPSNRLLIQTSNDGKRFTALTKLEPSRHGWQDWDSDYTHSVPEVMAKYFRFAYSKEGSEPGAEDLDAAKWKPVLKISGIELSSEPRIHQYEGKNGEVWRISKETTEQQVPQTGCVQMKNIIDLTTAVDKSGKLTWNVPAGNWTIIRIGHTSTGHRNETAGGGKGLECDKFDPEAITLQFNNWFGQFYQQGGRLADSVIKIFHVDSWECGSQNWSDVFRDEFKKRRGYDLYSYLPVMAGIPMETAAVSEKFLYDVRKTIAELINDHFYGTLQTLAHQTGATFTAESVAPTMLSDGMLHYSNVDVPMGEFWLRSPSHDKPNDMLDAISAAHIYGKNIVQAEAFTELRMQWDEHPGMLKTLADRNFALGINRLVYHVFMHNPWLNKKPGVTLDAIGLLFQRDQTWWPQARAWVDYAKRCQALLQMGRPVTDVAVFTGEEFPRRSLLPERLVPSIPGVFGKEAVNREEERLRNAGQPLIKQPTGVTYAANTTDAQTWNDPLRGYAYDSFNPDALLRLSEVKDGRIQLKSGASYGVLLVPGKHKMLLEGEKMSTEVAAKIKALAEAGATIILNEEPSETFGLKDKKEILQKMVQNFSVGSQTHHSSADKLSMLTIGKGKIVKGFTSENSFRALGIAEDVVATNADGSRTDSLVWTHRVGEGFDIYFLSNQSSSKKIIDFSLRVNGKVPEIWDPVSGTIYRAKSWKTEKERTVLPIRLDENGSLFVVLQQKAKTKSEKAGKNWRETAVVQSINGPWTVHFDNSFGGSAKPVVFSSLPGWQNSSDSAVRYYSGMAAYEKSFYWNKSAVANKPVWLDLGTVANMAEVFVNGISCSVAWTAPYRVDISKALKKGQNNLRIEVINTWNNRLVGDSRLPKEIRVTTTVYPFKMEEKPLLRAGLFGPVVIETER